MGVVNDVTTHSANECLYILNPSCLCDLLISILCQVAPRSDEVLASC